MEMVESINFIIVLLVIITLPITVGYGLYRFTNYLLTKSPHAKYYLLVACTTIIFIMMYWAIIGRGIIYQVPISYNVRIDCIPVAFYFFLIAISSFVKNNNSRKKIESLISQLEKN
jgi:hypothetical protein